MREIQMRKRIKYKNELMLYRKYIKGIHEAIILMLLYCNAVSKREGERNGSAEKKQTDG
jgi:hypothetical protein